MAFCKNCGVSINDEDKYCNSCGHNQLDNETMKSMKKDKKTVRRIAYIIFMVLVISIGIYSYIHITNKIAIKAENQVITNENKKEYDDLESVDSNQMGNTAANIKNKGVASIQGDTIYYSSMADFGYIYKMDQSGKIIKLVEDKRCTYINVIGNWIYYLAHSDHDSNHESNNYKIYKTKIDGSESKSLDVIVDSKNLSNYITILISKGNWLYYSTKEAIYKIKSDGSENKKIIDLTHSDKGNSNVDYLNIIDNTIYYHDCNDIERDLIYAVDISASTRKVVFKSPTYLNKIDVSNGWIYYVSNYELNKVKIGDSSITTILKGSNLNPIFDAELNVNGDWIYYAAGKEKRTLYRVKIDGSENMKLNSEEMINGINIVSDWYICPIGDTAKLSIGRLPVTTNSNNVEKKDEAATSPDKLKLISGAVSEAKNSNSKEISVDEAINMIKSKITLYEGDWLEYRKEERVTKKGTIPAELVGKDCYIIDRLSPPDICDGSYYVDKFSGTIYNLCQGNWKKVS